MNKTTSMLQRLSLILAVTAASYGLPAHAATTTVNAEASVSGSTTSTIGEKIDKGIDATKRVGRKTVELTKDAGHAVANTGRKAAEVTRNTGEKIAEKIPGTEANTQVKAEAAAQAAVKQQ
ncbi:MAG: hypothetical protein KIS62_03505 [Ramlibacter sp.]|nr:hypothetical protein [Ramlibacter sp.]MBX3657911.1 hypothetical protein [Ramlibacter sp.]MCW5648792.1 hypothetical protein [Ramlibacter sp.]